MFVSDTLAWIEDCKKRKELPVPWTSNKLDWIQYQGLTENIWFVSYKYDSIRSVCTTSANHVRKYYSIFKAILINSTQCLKQIFVATMLCLFHMMVNFSSEIEFSLHLYQVQVKHCYIKSWWKSCLQYKIITRASLMNYELLLHDSSSSQN